MLAIICAHVDARATIKVLTDTVKFQPVKLGFSRDAYGVITNTGPGNETLTDIRLFPLFSGGGEFQILTGAQTPLVLGAGQNDRILIHFQPQLSGTRTAFIRCISANDTVLIQLVGEGAMTAPDVITVPDSIDFGTRLPGEIVDTTVLMIAQGPDSATVNTFVVANNNAVLVFDAAPLDQTQSFPAVLHAGDTLRFRLRFSPILPAGTYTGGLTAVGTVTGSPFCVCKGAVEVPEFELHPGLVSFGIVPQGENHDTTIFLVNTSRITDHFAALTALNPPFSYVNAPTGAFDISAGDTLVLTIHLDASKAGQFSNGIDIAQVSPPYPTFDRLSLVEATVVAGALHSSSLAPLNVTCGIDSTFHGTFTIRDTGKYPVTVDALRVSDPNLTITGFTAPKTFAPSDAQTIDFTYRPSQLLVHDTTIFVRLLWKNTLVLLDSITIHVHPLETTVILSVASSPTERAVTVTPQLDPQIARYAMTTLVFDVRITPATLAQPDIASLIASLAPAVTVDTATIDSGEYRITLTSTSGPLPASIDSIIRLTLRFVVLTDSVATVVMKTTSPEFDGCLSFADDSITVTAPNLCGDPEMRQYLRSVRAGYSAIVRENPVVSDRVVVDCSLPVTSTVTASVESLENGTVVGAIDPSILSAGARTLTIDTRRLHSGAYGIVLNFVDDAGRRTTITDRFTLVK